MDSPDVADRVRAQLAQVLPDMPERAKVFTVLSEPADPYLQQLFFEFLEAEVPQIRTALEVDDLATLQRKVHSAKGLGGSVGYPEISALCLGIEERIQEGDADGTRRLVGALLTWHGEMAAAR